MLPFYVINFGRNQIGDSNGPIGERDQKKYAHVNKESGQTDHLIVMLKMTSQSIQYFQNPLSYNPYVGNLSNSTIQFYFQAGRQ